MLIDFFVAVPGQGAARSGAAKLEPVPVEFDAQTTQVFNAGAASCAVPGVRGRP